MSALLDFVTYQELSNWSVAHLLQNHFNYNQSFPLVKIGSFLKRNKTLIEIDDDTVYKRVTIRLYNNGVLVRDTEIGKNIGTKKQFIIKEGQFLLSKIDARNGAFGLATKEVDGAIITADFLAFDLDTTKIDPHFLVLMTTTEKFMQFAQSASSGTTGRQRIDESKFLETKIPLPSLETQQRIIQNYQAKIFQADTQEQEAKELEKEIENYLYGALEFEIFQEIKVNNNELLNFTRLKNINQWSIKDIINTKMIKSKYPLSSLSEIITNKPMYGSNSKGLKKKTDIRYIRITDINEDGTLNDEIVSSESPEEKYMLQENDFLIARSGNTVGKTFLYNESFGKCMFAGYLIKFTLNLQLINPHYLLLYTKSSIYKNWINSVQRIAGQPNINSQEYLESPIILPPLDIQQQIIQYVQKLKKQIIQLNETAKINRINSIDSFEKEIFDEA